MISRRVDMLFLAADRGQRGEAGGVVARALTTLKRSTNPNFAASSFGKSKSWSTLFLAASKRPTARLNKNFVVKLSDIAGGFPNRNLGGTKRLALPIPPKDQKQKNASNRIDNNRHAHEPGYIVQAPVHLYYVSTNAF